MVAPITASMVGGNELLHVVAGQACHQQTANLPPPHGSRVLPYHLGATQTAVNGIDGQMARAAPQAGAASAAAGTGDAPYTAEQVIAGAAVFGKQCASCHGAQLQGLAAPALTALRSSSAHFARELKRSAPAITSMRRLCGATATQARRCTHTLDGKGQVTFKVRLTRVAPAEVDLLFEFLVGRGLTRDGGDLTVPEQAIVALQAGVATLQSSPFTCRKAGRNPFLRELVIPFRRSGYVALFEIEDESNVAVVAVRHQRKDDYH